MIYSIITEIEGGAVYLAMLVTQRHARIRKNSMFQYALVVGRQDVVGAFVNLLDTSPAIDHIDEPGRHPMTPLLIKVGL